MKPGIPKFPDDLEISSVVFDFNSAFALLCAALIKSSTTFLICNLCEKITEIEEEIISKQFSIICDKLNSKYSNHNLEIFGTCVSCKEVN